MANNANYSSATSDSTSAPIAEATRLSIKQINMHHSKGSTTLIGKTLDSMQTKNLPLIYLLQEPWTKNNRIMGFKHNRAKLFYHKSDKNPRSGIVATEDMNVTFMPQLSDPDTTTIQVKINDQYEFLLCSIYLGHDSTEAIPGDMVRTIMNFSKDNRIPLIMGGDANAHHIVWGSSDINLRGERLLEFLVSTEMEILNKGNSPTFVTRNRTEVLDITLASRNIANMVKEWHVSPEETLSDHREIAFYLDCEIPPTPNFRNPRNTNWEVFRNSLESNLQINHQVYSELTSCEGLDNAVDCFSKAMKMAFIEACPERNRSNQKNKWWNAELSRLRKQSRRLLRLYLARKDTPQGPACHEVLRRSRNKYAKEIEHARNTDFKKFLSKVEGAKTTSRLHKILASDPQQGPGILRKPDGTFTGSHEETAKILLDTHFPGNIPGEASNNPELEYTLPIVDENVIDIFNMKMTEWALFSFDPFKSPGFDEIIPAFIQRSWEISGVIIHKFYEASLRLGYIPETWQKVKITFIPKPGKEDYTSAKSFRPISLTSFLLKGLEKIIDRHLREKLDLSETLHGSQHAFQKGRSTETALHSVVSLAEKAIAEKEYMLSTFLDIEGAFDNISLNAINEHISECGVSPSVRAWIKYMLSHRTICFTGQGAQVIATATKGTPQGGVLSPLLWIIIMNSLLKRLSERGFRVNGYADDLNINCTGKYLSTLTERTQTALKIVESWCTEVGLKVNPNKSEIIIFTHKRKFDGYKNPSLFGHEIQRKLEVKYLGVILDSKLNWSKHIEQKISKCIRIFWSCRSAIGKTWGLSPKCIRWIYTAIVRPTLAYGSFIWWQGTKTASIRMKLNHLQRVACLGITGALRTTPQVALDTILGLPRLEEFIQVEAMRTAYRLNTFIKPNIFIRNTHIDSLTNLTQIDKMIEAHTDRIAKPVFHFDRQFDVKITRNLEDFAREVDWADARFYTDASVNSEGSGIAYFDEMANQAQGYPMGTNACIKQLEITAIAHCAKSIINKNIIGNIAVFTDSLAAIKTLEKCEINSKIALECRDYLQTIAMSNPIRLIWVKAHSNIKGNDIADTIAKAATAMPVMGPEPFLPVDYIRIRGVLETWLAERLRLNWHGESGCEQTKLFITSTNCVLLKQTTYLDKWDLRTTIGLLTGHAKVNNHMRRMGLRDDPDCRLCGRDVETTSHLICDCESLKQVRLRVLGKVRIHPSEIKSIRGLLQFYKEACLQSHCLNLIFGVRH